VGREESAPKSLVVAEADAVSQAEGSISETDKARLRGTAGVSSPGHVFKGTSQELGKDLYISLRHREW
jgi:hypothetical protein